MGTKEGSPKLALAKVPYQPLRRTSTLPPEDRTSTSGKFAAVVAKIPELAAVNIEDGDEYGFKGIGELTEVSSEEERVALAQKNLREWLEQFSEFNEQDDEGRESFFRNLFQFSEKAGAQISDDQLVTQFNHLLAIKKGDKLNVARRYFEQATDKPQYIGFYLQHFPEWESIKSEDKNEVKAAVLAFIVSKKETPSNIEIAASIINFRELVAKKNIVRQKLKTISEESLPDAARYPLQLYIEKIIDENPSLDALEILTQLSHLVFNIIQERARYHQGKRATSVSQELRLVAAVLDTHADTLNQLSSIDDMRQTIPDSPSAIAIEASVSRTRVTIPAAPLPKKGQPQDK